MDIWVRYVFSHGFFLGSFQGENFGAQDSIFPGRCSCSSGGLRRLVPHPQLLSSTPAPPGAANAAVVEPKKTTVAEVQVEWRCGEVWFNNQKIVRDDDFFFVEERHVTFLEDFCRLIVSLIFVFHSADFSFGNGDVRWTHKFWSDFFFGELFYNSCLFFLFWNCFTKVTSESLLRSWLIRCPPSASESFIVIDSTSLWASFLFVHFSAPAKGSTKRKTHLTTIGYCTFELPGKFTLLWWTW